MPQEEELVAMESQKEMDLVRQVLSYERDRVRYLLKAYLRARLHKIQQFAGVQDTVISWREWPKK